MSKCPKCENETFSVDTETNKTIAFVRCAECESIVGTLENIDFRKWYDKIISNHGFFENRINEIESKMNANDKEVNGKLTYIIDMIETIINKRS